MKTLAILAAFAVVAAPAFASDHGHAVKADKKVEVSTTTVSTTVTVSGTHAAH